MNCDRSVPVYKIHPGIGIARLGNSPDEFCISPETPAALPIECDDRGNPVVSADGEHVVRVSRFKDAIGRIKRQAARFQIYVYDEESPKGRPLKIGDPVQGGGNRGTLIDIQWRVYLANKKSCWYEFQQLEGEHGYGDDHPLRNADIKDEKERHRLIIDPGPQVVDLTTQRRASFDRNTGDVYASTFPPRGMTPHDIDTLGEILTDDAGKLLVLGGHGRSGSFLTGFGQPRIDAYANNDGWFDDTSDGPVHARLIMHSEEVDATRYIDVEYPSWVVAAYPAYVPQVLDIVTLEDVVQNTAITEFATRTDLYGKANTFNDPQQIDPSDANALAIWKASSLRWNPDYKPWFYRDIWTILFRADEYTYLTNVLAGSNYPHNQTNRGNFDPEKLSIPPVLNEAAYERAKHAVAGANQNGSLFLEALEAGLLLVDQQAANTNRKTAPVRLLLTSRDGSAQQQLLEALQNFAVQAAGGQSVEDVEAYLAHWRQIYAESQEPEINPGSAYRDATDRLKGAIVALANELEPHHRHREAHEDALFRTPPSQQPVSQDAHVRNLLEKLSSQYRSGSMLADALEKARAQTTVDPFRTFRTYLFDLLRRTGEENVFRVETRPDSRVHHLPLMPLLSGDNPISDTLPSKFLRLTDYQLYLLRQWAEGKFFNEKLKGWAPWDKTDPWQPYAAIESLTGEELDRNVLTNLAGGAFCPGAEIGWIIRNPSIYLEPYRIKADPAFSSFRQTAANENQVRVPEVDYSAYSDTPLSLGSDYATGLQPGDLTKMMALPWQADFNECSTQEINVSYELWNTINTKNVNDPWLVRENQVWETLWWPAHRPMQAAEVVPGTEHSTQPQFLMVKWAWGIPQTPAGDLKMTTEWSRLGFVVRNPYVPESKLDQPSPNPPPKYVSVERNTNPKGKPQEDE